MTVDFRHGFQSRKQSPSATVTQNDDYAVVWIRWPCCTINDSGIGDLIRDTCVNGNIWEIKKRGWQRGRC
jgi:hypothetical protein